MSNRIKIKHGNTVPQNSDLEQYELGWHGNYLYTKLPNGSGDTITKIGTSNLTDIETSIDTMGSSIDTMSQSINDLDQSVDSIETSIDNINVSIQDMDQDITALDEATTAIQTSLLTKITKPNVTGTSGQVLTSDGADNVYWSTLNNIDAPVGTINLWGGSTIPNGWLLCNGQAVSRTAYSELFNIIGTTFGSGNGSTTFNLPNYNNRMPVGAGDSYHIGNTGGEATHKLTANELPQLSGTFRLQGDASNAGIDAPATGSGIITPVNGSGSGSTVAATGWSCGLGFDISFGSDQPHNNLPPYLAINYIIKAFHVQIVPETVTIVDNLTTQSPTDALSANMGYQLKLLIDQLGVDYIVDQGTSGYWRYRKWNSGTYECWYYRNLGSYAVTSAWASGYYRDVGAISYPITFVSYPTVNVTSGTTGCNAWLAMGINGTTSQTGSFCLYSFSNETVNLELNISVCGKWK